jgi:hypothetical protein
MPCERINDGFDASHKMASDSLVQMVAIKSVRVLMIMYLFILFFLSFFFQSFVPTPLMYQPRKQCTQKSSQKIRLLQTAVNTRFMWAKKASSGRSAVQCCFRISQNLPISQGSPPDTIQSSWPLHYVLVTHRPQCWLEIHGDQVRPRSLSCS